jgi:hypothetical protein
VTLKQAWTPAETDKLKQLKSRGLSDYEIADILKRTFGSVNTKITKLKQSGQLKQSQVPASTMPLWNEPLVSEGDTVIITDLEAPFQHSEFINRVLDLADSWGIQTLHLGGDLLHYDTLSAWGSEWTQDKEELVDLFMVVVEKYVANKKKSEVIEALEEYGMTSTGGLSGELKDSRRVFRSFGSFKNVYVELGNHDDRYLRTLQQALSPKELLHQIDKDKDERWHIAPYYYGFIDTEKGRFRVSHPRGAGQKAAVDLAVQYHQHVIMGHSHRWNISRDPSGDYWAIQTGHCVDEDRLAYVGQRDAKRDAHVLGATIIRGGYPFVLSPESPWQMLRRM